MGSIYTSDTFGKVTNIGAVVDLLIYIFGLILTSYTIYFAYALPVPRLRYSIHFLGIGLALFYLMKSKEYYERDAGPGFDFSLERGYLSPIQVFSEFLESERYRKLMSFVTIIFAILSIVSAVYFEFNFERLRNSAPIVGWTQLDYFVGGIVIVLATDSTGRAFGNAIAIVVILSIVYAFVGPYLPGILWHNGMSPKTVIENGAIAFSGVYGFILGVGATWVAVFIMFAGMVKSYGGFEYILGIGEEIQASFRTGVVQVAVTSSLLMGSITGASAANTATTGSFTIPMMKNQGVRGDYAGGIEAVASSGGQLMPPVMGVAAFLMADFLGIPYVSVIKAGIIPAVLFYFSVALSAHVIVNKFDWINHDLRKFNKNAFRNGLHYAVPILVLVYTLVILRYTPMSAGMYSIGSLVLVVLINDLLQNETSFDTIRNYSKSTLTAISQGGREMAPLIGIFASLGIILAMITQTGLAQKISLQMIVISGGSFILLLVLAMIASILFGMGVPAPAAYILVVILVVPALARLGVPEIATHLFVFWYAMLSTVTPPVAASAAVGASIAGVSFMKTAYQSIRVAGAGFIIPYALIMNPSLVIWEFPQTVVVFLFAIIATFGLVFAIFGHDSSHELGVSHRILYLIAALASLFAPIQFKILSSSIIVVMLLRYKILSLFGRFGIDS